MSTSSAMTANSANSHTPQACTIETQSVYLNAIIADCAKRAFVKPFSALMQFLHIGESAAKKKLGEQRAFTGAELARLIRTEEGFQFIVAIMADADPAPRWWRVCAPVMEAAEVRKMQIVAQRRVAKVISEALNADDLLSATLAKADALAVQDPDHMRPHLDALRSMAGASNRPVARKR